ncbi:MAG: hypothetical protein DMF78_26090 [Acidobacteria bacterium]|nr:MAG: hypothetical protein DMF78_26090 [Acidobacteriota bacterium]
MSSEIERLEAQLEAAFEGPAWHGPSVLEALDGVTAEGASAHPLTGAHSIWELVRLDQPITPEPPYPAYTQFIGITQHDRYHAGQIAILKKALKR